MFDAFVINMDHRTDRWESMQSNWSHIFKLHRIPGVKSQKKYYGCGQAHVNAYQAARKLNPEHPFYIVMEDDVKPLKTKDYYTYFLETLFLLRDTSIDSISLNSTFDKQVSTEICLLHPSLPKLLYVDPNLNLVSGASFMIYSRNIFKHMEEYQAHLNASFFIIPNDRLFTTKQFGFYTFCPWRCYILNEMVCDLSDLANASDNFGGGAIYDYKENLATLVKNSQNKKVVVLPTKNSSLNIKWFFFNKIIFGIFLCFIGILFYLQSRVA
jgi:hypothetical protein